MSQKQGRILGKPCEQCRQDIFERRFGNLVKTFVLFSIHILCKGHVGSKSILTGKPCERSDGQTYQQITVKLCKKAFLGAFSFIYGSSRAINQAILLHNL